MPPETDGTAPPVAARYSRQALFKGIGAEGQARIAASRVTVVGCGALGCLQATLMARAGAGTVRLIDRDVVEETNLHRQILFDDEDARRQLPKAIVAADKLRVANPTVVVEGIVDDLDPSSVDALLDGSDVVLDGTDNFETRLLLNDWCVKTATPWVYGGCVGSTGMTFPILPGESACLRCVFPTAPSPGATPTCDTMGVISPVATLVASLQVAEALKILSGVREKVMRSMALVDVWENRLEAVQLAERDPACPCCGGRRFDYLTGAQHSAITSLCGRGAVQIKPPLGGDLDLEELAGRLAPLGRVDLNKYLLRAEVDGVTLTIFGNGRAIVAGVKDESAARSIYARYVGH